MRIKILVAAAASALLAAPTVAAKPPPGIQAAMSAHPGGTLGSVPVTPDYVYGQSYCYTAAFQYTRAAGSLATEGLFIRPYWCARPGMPPHIYGIDLGYRYQICSGLIQCAGTSGPFLASGGIGWGWADYEYIGYYKWTASGITANAMLHMAFELQETGVAWYYGWGS